jgi:hypothetical protein
VDVAVTRVHDPQVVDVDEHEAAGWTAVARSCDTVLEHGQEGRLQSKPGQRIAAQGHRIARLRPREYVTQAVPEARGHASAVDDRHREAAHPSMTGRRGADIGQVGRTRHCGALHDGWGLIQAVAVLAG